MTNGNFINEIENFLFEGEQGDKILQDPKFGSNKLLFRDLKRKIGKRFDIWAQLIIIWSKDNNDIDYENLISKIVWYEQNKKNFHNIIPGQERNILAFNLDDFYKFVEEAKEKIKPREPNSIREDDDAIIYYEDKSFVLVRPKTHKGSCKYGASTRWCITTKDNDDNWKSYSREIDYLFLIFKNLQNTKNPNRTLGFATNKETNEFLYVLNAEDDEFKKNKIEKKDFNFLIDDTFYMSSRDDRIENLLKKINDSGTTNDIESISCTNDDFQILERLYKNYSSIDQNKINNLLIFIKNNFPQIIDVFSEILYFYMDTIKSINQDSLPLIKSILEEKDKFLKKYKIEIVGSGFYSFVLPKSVENYSLPGFCQNASWENADIRFGIFYIQIHKGKIRLSNRSSELLNPNSIIWEKGTWLKGTVNSGRFENVDWRGGIFSFGYWINGYWHKGIWKNEYGYWQKGFIKNKQGHWVLSKKNPEEYYKMQNIKMEEAIILKEILSQIKKNNK